MTLVQYQASPRLPAVRAIATSERARSVSIVIQRTSRLWTSGSGGLPRGARTRWPAEGRGSAATKGRPWSLYAGLRHSTVERPRRRRIAPQACLQLRLRGCDHLVPPASPLNKMRRHVSNQGPHHQQRTGKRLGGRAHRCFIAASSAAINSFSCLSFCASEASASAAWAVDMVGSF